MNEKVKLPKEVCDALGFVIPKMKIMDILYACDREDFYYRYFFHDEKVKCLNEINSEILMRALVLGYEPELTAEEQMKAYYKHLNYPQIVHSPSDLMRHAIKMTLQIHGIKYDWLEDDAD